MKLDYARDSSKEKVRSTELNAKNNDYKINHHHLFLLITQ